MSEIQRMRGVCRSLRDLVDESGNEVLLYRLAINRGVQRLRELHEQTVMYTSESRKFFMQLEAFMNIRLKDARSLEPRAFVMRWTSNLPANRGRKATHFQLNRILRLVESLIGLHTRFHAPENHKIPGCRGLVGTTDADGWTRISRVPSYRTWRRQFWRLLHRAGLTKTNAAGVAVTDVPMRKIFKKIRRDGLFDLNFVPAGDSDEILPILPLTSLGGQVSYPLGIGKDGVRCHAAPEAYRPVCTRKALQQFLGPGILALPQNTSNSTSNLAAYCVREHWAYEQIKKAAGGEPLSWKARAQVMEQLILF